MLGFARRGRGAAARPASAEPLAQAGRLGTGWEPAALLLLTIVLLSFGLVNVYSASAVMAQSQGLADYHFVVRQAAGGAMALVLLAFAANLGYRVLRPLAWPLLFAAVAMLVVVVLPGTEAIAPRINGARRWLLLGPAQIQPSEFAKLAVMIWTAMLAVKKQDKLPSLTRGLLPFLIVWGAIEMLIFLQPNLSAALLVLLLASLVVFAGGARIGHFLLLALVGLPILWAKVESAAYRMGRIAAFLDASQDPTGVSYQINQSLIAIGSGGVVGRGFGEGLQKFGYLPEPHNDFIFAMIGEEWGFAGSAALIAIYTLFGLIGYRVARQAPDLFGSLLAVGMTNLIVVQGLMHMAVTTALLPTTGVTLPFVSYGRSSLLVCAIGVGILINVARGGAGIFGTRRRGVETDAMGELA